MFLYILLFNIPSLNIERLLDFILNDLNLYLDIHPDNMEMYKLFKKINKERKYYVDLS